MYKCCKKPFCTELVNAQKGKKNIVSHYCSKHAPIPCHFTNKKGICNKLTLHSSGLCPKHFATAEKLVRQGKITYKELFDKKKIKCINPTA